jgi:hypothetical protein
MLFSPVFNYATQIHGDVSNGMWNSFLFPSDKANSRSKALLNLANLYVLCMQLTVTRCLDCVIRNSSVTRKDTGASQFGRCAHPAVSLSLSHARDANKHPLHWYETCRQMPPSFWLVAVLVVMSVPNGYTAGKLPVSRRHRRDTRKGPCI